MPIDQPPAIIQPASTAQDQWATVRDAIIREEAIASKYGADVMNFTGAAANATTERAESLKRVAALQAIAAGLIKQFETQGLKFIEDEWQ